MGPTSYCSCSKFLDSEIHISEDWVNELRRKLDTALDHETAARLEVAEASKRLGTAEKAHEALLQKAK